MTKIDINDINPAIMRGLYCGIIKESPNLPPDFKRDLIKMIQYHFFMMSNTIGLVELAWRRNMKEKGK